MKQYMWTVFYSEN